MIPIDGPTCRIIRLAQRDEGQYWATHAYKGDKVVGYVKIAYITAISDYSPEIYQKGMYWTD